MLSYVYYGTNDLERAIRFYDAALAALEMQRCIIGDPDWDRTSAGWGCTRMAVRASSRSGSAYRSISSRRRPAMAA